MALFKLISGEDTIRKHDLEILREAIFNLKDEVNSFVVLEPKKPIDNSIYLQAACQEGEYFAEIRFVFGSDDEYKHYSRTFATKEDLFEVFAQYYAEEKVPNVKDWNDDTKSFSEESEDNMVKLYKEIDGEVKYFEVWLTDTGLTIHTGVLGDVGETREYDYNENDDLPPRMIMAKFASDQKMRGYAEIEDLEEIVLQYSYSEKDDLTKMLKKRNRIEEILNECLGWTGNGHCDGGDIGSGTINIFCYVVDKEIAIKSALEELAAENLLDGLKIASPNQQGDYELLYPEGENFSIL